MRSALLALLILSRPLLIAQSTPDCLERTIPVGLKIQPGRGVELNKLHFRATSQGQALEVLSAAADAAPRRAVLLVDTSGSMGPGPTGVRKPAIQLAFELGEEAVRKLPPTVSLALILFGELEDKLDFAASRDALARKLDPAQPALVGLAHGRTRLYDALQDASRLMSPPRIGDVIYVISDGGDNLSKTRRQAVRRALQAAGTRVFVVLLDQLPNTIDEETGRADLRRLAEETGGFTLYVAGFTLPRIAMVTNDRTDFTLDPKQRAHLTEATAAMYDTMVAPNLLRLRLPRKLDRFENWKLEMVDNADRAEKNVTLFYPRELAPCEKR